MVEQQFPKLSVKGSCRVSRPPERSAGASAATLAAALPAASMSTLTPAAAVVRASHWKYLLAASSEEAPSPPPSIESRSTVPGPCGAEAVTVGQCHLPLHLACDDGNTGRLSLRGRVTLAGLGTAHKSRQKMRSLFLTRVDGPVAISSTRPRGMGRPPMPGAAGATCAGAASQVQRAPPAPRLKPAAAAAQTPPATAACVNRKCTDAQQVRGE